MQEKQKVQKSLCFEVKLKKAVLIIHITVHAIDEKDLFISCYCPLNLHCHVFTRARVYCTSVYIIIPIVMCLPGLEFTVQVCIL